MEGDGVGNDVRDLRQQARGERHREARRALAVHHGLQPVRAALLEHLPDRGGMVMDRGCVECVLVLRQVDRAERLATIERFAVSVEIAVIVRGEATLARDLSCEQSAREWQQHPAGELKRMM